MLSMSFVHMHHANFPIIATRATERFAELSKTRVKLPPAPFSKLDSHAIESIEDQSSTLDTFRAHASNIRSEYCDVVR